MILHGTNILIDSISAYLAVIQNFPSDDKDGYIFRGQSNIEWPLKPKAGRDEFFPVTKREDDYHRRR